jgi:hypothetical protein
VLVVTSPARVVVHGRAESVPTDSVLKARAGARVQLHRGAYLRHYVCGVCYIVKNICKEGKMKLKAAHKRVHKHTLFFLDTTHKQGQVHRASK